MKNLLVVTSSFDKDSFVYELSSRLAQKCRVYVITPDAFGQSRDRAGENLHVIYCKQFPFGRWSLAYGDGIIQNLKRNKFLCLLLPFYFAYLVLAIRETVREHNIRVIHAHWLVPNALAAVISKKIFGLDVKILGTAHGSDVRVFSCGLLLRKVLKFTLSNTDSVTVVGSPLAATVRELGYGGPLSVMPMGVDTDKFFPAEKAPAAPQIIFVGLLIPIKGAAYLLQAMRTVADEFPAAKLTVVGDGGESAALEHQARELGIAASTLFTGMVRHSELPAYLNRADIFVNPAIVAEGFGLSTIEAMSCGLTAIVTDYPAASDFIEDGINGYLVPQKDAPALARKIIHALKNPLETAELGKRARKSVVERYDWRQVSANYYAVLRQLSEPQSRVQ